MKCRKKQVVVEVKRVPPREEFASLEEYCEALSAIAGWCSGSHGMTGGTWWVSLTTSRGGIVAYAGDWIVAYDGDWIVKVGDGDFRQFSHSEFTADYEPVDTVTFSAT